MFKEWLTKLHFVIFSKRRSEIDEELQFHIDQQTEANLAAGMTPVEARRQAFVALGGVEKAREQAYEQRPGYYFETITQDVHYSVRGFRRNPVFTLAIILILMVNSTARKLLQ